ncbi:reverse transcriptase domain-containing protein [Tanacetum coccineum]
MGRSGRALPLMTPELFANSLNLSSPDWTPLSYSEVPFASVADKLDDALWAFRTAYKTPIGCTPYKLVYEKACHLIIEATSTRAKLQGGMVIDLNTLPRRGTSTTDGCLARICLRSFSVHGPMNSGSIAPDFESFRALAVLSFRRLELHISAFFWRDHIQSYRLTC